MITEALNACGVWPRRRLARGGMSRMVFSPPTSMIVSAEGIATSTALWVSSARKQSVMIRGLTSGRTASWSRTLHSPSGSAASARSVVSLRVAAPSRICDTLS